MKKKIIASSIILFLAVLAIIVYAQAWGTATLTGTVKLEDGTAVDGTDVFGLVFLTEVLNYYEVDGDTIANLSMKNTTVDASGSYSFSNLENGLMYTLEAFYVNSTGHVYQSNSSNASIVMNSTFATHYNTTYNVTFLNSSTGTAEYNITVKAY